MCIKFFHLAYAMHLPLSDLIHDCVEVYMDEFTAYGNTFQEALDNLEKVLIRCQETNLALSHESVKCY